MAPSLTNRLLNAPVLLLVLGLALLTACSGSDAATAVTAPVATATGTPAVAPTPTHVVVPVASSVVSPTATRFVEARSGVSVLFPDESQWEFRSTIDGERTIEWGLIGTDYTILAMATHEGFVLDDLVAERESWYADEEPDWFQETTVPGADRAVLLTQRIGGSSHSYNETLLIESNGYTVEVMMRLMEVDIGVAPLDDMQAFVASASANS